MGNGEREVWGGNTVQDGIGDYIAGGNIPSFRLPSRGASVDRVFASILACKAASEALNAFAHPPNLSHRSLFCTSFGEPWNLTPMDFSCESWKGLFRGFLPFRIPSPPRSVVMGLVMVWRRRVARHGGGRVKRDASEGDGFRQLATSA